MRKNDYGRKSNGILKTIPYVLIAVVLALLVAIAINA